MAEYEVFDPVDPNDEFKEYSNDRKHRWRNIIILVIIIAVGAYLLTGVYQVGPSEVALVKTFGAYSSTTGPGIHLHLPYPFQSHVIVDVRTINKIEIGFRTTSSGRTTSYVFVEEEAEMITGDQNIISIEAIVQYRVSDPVDYAFNVIQGDDLVKLTSESVLREMVALLELEKVLTTERDKVAMETARRIQEIMNDYEAGIQIENVYLQDVTPPDPVVPAFDDVNNARQDQQTSINEAQRYANDVIPRAEGEAVKILNDAQAYAYEQISKATGEAERFRIMLEEYRKSEEITKNRLILDSIQKMLENSKIKVISEKGDTLNFINIAEVMGDD
ncbi:MAG TPA: FtsH protease activity modulator HflK [Defluviitoga tunisiensis]|uniref:Protein HflK n=1 Tax=Defluviitoga tunisiensis TaxID=1006576 RepID=A0A0C7NZY4_DEFTU|nr:FtsH protease activity modulator HflK [Defluviitoga tunisiensis]MDD3601441.1 FtsH protease activity modulator HflK [Defluviitoga tunisiensis]MDY0379875.1 FtsH protease activity modulator HflK [Defluviitoga tunisiensis]CEP77565.1 HflK protein [Defluviitoga tunisiensis]HOB55543.1 FtsH protease activity modulator HflK [Defluviitoga tunisiensis]HOK17011.1 FtsH protease activity modulator HflK [Defluviitoga tunisiensis]